MEYIKQKLTYTPEGELLDQNGHAIMMKWEWPIMQKQAETIAAKGGRILNIGFGMGLIDSCINSYPNVEHWIIEAHPDVQQKMMSLGWLNKAKCIFKKWQEVLPYLPQFDGIYIDTWDEDLTPFLRNVKTILKPNGVFTMFNNPRADVKGLHMDEREYEAISTWADVKFETFQIPYVAPENVQRTDGKFYWSTNQKTYWNPIITHKQK